MVWVGHVDSQNAAAPNLPFTLALKRPDRTRFEITALNQVIVRVFDGKEGWKLRPSSGAGPDLRGFTADEVKFARDEQVIDGPLLDHAAKGIAVALEGVDRVDGHDAYRLFVHLSSGAARHVWVDTQSFLDIKYDRPVRSASGQLTTIEVMYRDFKDVDGLKIPFVIESGAPGVDKRGRLVIEKISLNPPLDDLMFAKPVVPGRHHSVSVGIDAPTTTGVPHPQASSPLP
ncbi:hypothetical protein LMG28138_06083 [Pararobbsia alpina]|uniref:Outer membrane lipoprotein-sorting protein n=2 Tax=Pararobbsia alpina TaxID=621374 RepID=A0A6S7BPX1_9BURK|nr:hypothetical protein LMG28138_06083 [Pararobbsia alpina]